VTFPAAQTIQHLVYTPGAVDAHNNPKDEWAGPVDREVYGVAPKITTEPAGTQVVTGVTVLGPVFAVDPRDKFVHRGDTYMVVGEVADWDAGPFGYEPGMTFDLKKVRGGR
jgi:hypothetical protein